MLRKIFAALLIAALPTLARAQSAPSFLSYGYTPSAGDWRGAFASKQDVLNYTPLSLSGGTMRGKLYTQPATVNGAGFSILPGLAPTAPINGDFWIVGGTLYVQLNGVTTTFATSQSVAAETTRAQAAEQANSTAISNETTRATTAEATKAAKGANSDITSLSGITTPLSGSQGGTGYGSVSAALDGLFSSTQGAILYRGVSTWLGLAPGASGQVLTTGGAAANPSWTTVSAGTTLRSFRNRLINGNFAINQRAAASASTAYSAGAYVMDRWKAGSGGATLSYATAANGDVTATITAGTLLQVIEGALYLPEGGSYIASWTGTSTCRAYQGTATGSYVASPFTVSSWTAGTNGTLECSTGTLTLAQFEPGTTATTFERRDDELRRCQRYYEVGQSAIIGSAYAVNAFVGGNVWYKVTKRTAASPQATRTTGTNDNGVQGTDYVDVNGFRIYTSASVVTTNVQLIATWIVNAEL